jgi:N-acetylmuramoyl-L-alanine amidase
MQTDNIDILARTIYGEARGEYDRLDGGLACLIAVGNVVMNRLNTPRQYGQTIQEVCHKPWQFSCWNTKDPNQGLLMASQITDPLFTVCLEVATKVAKGAWPDLTKGCDHYHTTSLNPVPSWANGQKPKLRLSNHLFYQLRKGK